jgi:hypothetical protein
MKRIFEPVLGFLNGCAVCIAAAAVYIALTLFPPRNRF